MLNKRRTSLSSSKFHRRNPFEGLTFNLKGRVLLVTKHSFIHYFMLHNITTPHLRVLQEIQKKCNSSSKKYLASKMGFASYS
jgi:hypothetical protein